MNINRIADINGNAYLGTVTVADIIDADLPAVQTVRGPVWPLSQTSQYIDDVVNGHYTPPLTIADDGENRVIVDGLQRRTALAAGVRLKRIDPEMLVYVVVVETVQVDIYFQRLNIGIPVGKSLVVAAGVPCKEAVFSVAGHPLFSNMGMSALQKQRAAHADMAIAALSIVGGWTDVTSNSKDAIKWLTDNTERITPDVIARTSDILTAIDTAAERYRAFVTAHPKSKPQTVTARGLLSDLRKKNILYTVMDAVNQGMDATMVLAALTFRDRLDMGATYTETLKNGKTRERRADWTVGGGSSGSNADFVQRQIVLQSVVDGLGAADIDNGLTYQAEAAKPKATKTDDDLAGILAGIVG